MKKLRMFSLALAATLLLGVPSQSQAFWFFGGGGFSFGFGGGSWWGPGYWHRPWYGPGYWHRPWWHRHLWNYPGWGFPYLGLPYGVPALPAVVATPKAEPPRVRSEK